MYRSIIGIDVGGTKTAIVEASANADLLQRREFPTNAHLPFDTVFPDVCLRINETIEEARFFRREPVALSVSIGGPLKIGEGFLLDPPHLPGWHGISLKERLRERFPEYPVFVEHDGNAGALAEFYFGVGRGRPNLQHLVFLTFGTGLGAGIILNGQVLHGSTDTAGEVGHLRLSDNGPIGFGKSGSWEGLASGKGLVEIASKRFPHRWNPGTPIKKIVTDILEDDPEARVVAEEVGFWMGRGIALLIDTLNPEVIVLGSLAVLLGDRILEPARKSAAREALPQAVAACEILPAGLGLRIGDVASIMAALQNSEIRTLFNQADENEHQQ